MWNSRRLVKLFGMGVAAGFAALVLPTATAAADPLTEEGPWESCNGAVCLVMGDVRAGGWAYEGIRPFITDWKGNQPYDVRYTGEGGEAINAGSYTVKIEEFWNPLYSTSAYQFGNFVGNPEAPDDLALGNFAYLSGSSMYRIDVFDGAFTNLTINNVGAHDLNYWVMSYGDITSTVVTDPNNFVSAGYIEFGDSDPIQLWNSLFHSWTPSVPDYLVPDNPFVGIDFDPDDFFTSALATL
ncbi:hypothetical protein [Mycolicibacter minnesotensis]